MTDTKGSQDGAKNGAKRAHQTPNFSAAMRINAIAQALRRQDPNRSVGEAWAEALQVPAGPKRDTAVLQGMVDFREQVDLMYEAVSGTGAEESFNRIKPALEAIAGGASLGAAWSGPVGNLSSDVLLAISIAAPLLPRDEVEIPKEQVERLLREAEEFLNALPDLGFSPPLEAAMRRAVRSLIEALHRYPITGARALAELDQRFAGLLYQNRAEIQSAGGIVDDKSKETGANWFLRLCIGLHFFVTTARDIRDNRDFLESTISAVLENEALSSLAQAALKRITQ
jgi:hypothetical protein